MKDVLDGKKVKYEEIDISSSSEDRDKMRELCGDPKALPPQIFRGNKYLGVSMIRSLKKFFFLVFYRLTLWITILGRV